jgi:hypothetical protein
MAVLHEQVTFTMQMAIPTVSGIWRSRSTGTSSKRPAAGGRLRGEVWERNRAASDGTDNVVEREALRANIVAKPT